MRSVRDVIVGALICLCAANSHGQGTAGGEVKYLLRIEHMLPTEDTCALVREDGQYHFERLLRDNVEIFEDSLSSSVLQSLRDATGVTDLKALSQEKIRQPLTNLTMDALILSIYRDGTWQNLRFPSTESRAPYAEMLTPLVAWLDGLDKTHLALLSEESARNNCNPPAPLELKTRNHQPSIPFVLRAIITRYDASHVDSSCVVVYPDGKYHFEHEIRRPRAADEEVNILGGNLSRQSFEELKAVLNDPVLSSRTKDKLQGNNVGVEGQVAALAIPREDRIQQLSLWKFLSGARSGAAGMPIVEDNGIKILKPLQRWIKVNVEDAGTAPQGPAVRNRCEPVRQP